MGAITRKFQEKVDCVVTESYVYTPIDLSVDKEVKRVIFEVNVFNNGNIHEDVPI